MEYSDAHLILTYSLYQPGLCFASVCEAAPLIWSLGVTRIPRLGDRRKDDSAGTIFINRYLNTSQGAVSFIKKEGSKAITLKCSKVN